MELKLFAPLYILKGRYLPMETIDQKKGEKEKYRRNQIYEAVINKRTTQSLLKMEHEFEELHRDDSDNVLVEYVIQEALRLGHVPGKEEIVGWSYLISRFGSWDKVLSKASLKKNRDGFSEGTNTLRMAEIERQKALYKEKKREKKIKAQERVKQQREKKTAKEK